MEYKACNKSNASLIQWQARRRGLELGCCLDRYEWETIRVELHSLTSYAQAQYWMFLQ